MVNQDVAPHPLETLGEACRSARDTKEWSVQALSKKARVGTATIVDIEGGRKTLVAKFQKSRRLTPRFAGSLIRLALVLGKEPASWLELVSDYHAFDAAAVERFVSAAHAQLKSSNLAQSSLPTQATEAAKVGEAEDDCTLKRVRKDLKALEQPKVDGRDRGRSTVDVKVCLLTCARPRNHADPKHLPHDTAQRRFYERLVGLIFGAIDPRLKPKFVGADGNSENPGAEPGSFAKVMKGLTETPRRFDLLVGPWSMVARSSYDVTFTKLPCLWHRIACLTDSLNPKKLTWENVRAGAGETAVKPRVVTIEGEAADVYLRSFRDYTEHALNRVETYNTEQFASRLIELEEDEKKDLGVVGVIGEFEARNVLWYYRDQWQARGDRKKKLIDLAAPKAANAPRYPLAVATAASDLLWTETIGRAIEELFVNAPALIAEVYGDYLVAALQETVYLFNNLEPIRDLLKEMFFNDQRQVPGYLRLDSPEGIPVSSAFRRGLEDYLVPKLNKLLSALDVPQLPDTWTGKDLFNSMVPWRTEGERFDEIAAAIRRIENALHLKCNSEGDSQS
jgi:hypothetical protein